LPRPTAVFKRVIILINISRRNLIAHTRNMPRSQPSSSTRSATEMLPTRLRELLSAISGSIDQLKSWPAESAERDGAAESVHDVNTAEFVRCVRHIASAVGRVEKCANEDACRKILDGCRVPLDLLDLLDFGGGKGSEAIAGTNPELYARAIMEEALRQHAALQRRRGALRGLGMAVREWLEGGGETARPPPTKRKRAHEDVEASEDVTEGSVATEDGDGNSGGRPAKLKRLSKETSKSRSAAYGS